MTINDAATHSRLAAFSGGAIIGALGGLIGLGGAKFRLLIANLLAGSLVGAWLRAGWATRLASDTLYRVIAGLLLAIAVVLVLGHDTMAAGALLSGGAQAVAGVAAGFVIGIVASLLGVAGGELLIPTLVLLLGADIKLAGSLSLAVSLPTMLVGFARYSQDRSFTVLGGNIRFVLVMAAGSIFGSFVGGQLLGVVPSSILLPLLAVIRWLFRP